MSTARPYSLSMIATVCPLTGYDLQKAQFPPAVDSSICYVFQTVGKVRIALPTYLEFIHSGNFKRPELAGICRNASEINEEPPLQSKANMRSACETLSYILEPLREECERIFSKPSTNTFFQLVNNFDVRHNKSTTSVIEHPEQLEWIFYTLLNSINTYYKLKAKLS